MSYIEKVFKQYPFIYFIKGEFYAFGTGVCSKCDDSSAFLETRYNNFVNNVNEELKPDEAWRLFCKLVTEANFVKDKEGVCLKPIEKIKEFQFDPKALKELEEQVDRYVNFWQKNNLKDYIKHF